MADFMSEVDSLFSIIEREVEELRELNPEHELLEFAEPVLETGDWNLALTGKFYAEFNPKGDKTWIQMRVGYSIAIRRALGRIPPDAPAPKQATPIDIDDEDIPF